MSLLHKDLVLTKKMALADKYLIVKDRLKLIRAGACDPMTDTSPSGDGIQGSLSKGGLSYGQCQSVHKESGVQYFIDISPGK